MRVSFTVAGKVVGTNAAYKRSGSTAGRVGFYMTKEAKEFKARIWLAGFIAANESKWPVDYDGPISLTLKTFNCRQDVDSASKLEMDAMQGVFYINDKQVMKLTAEKAKDDKGPRVEIEVEMI